MGGRVGARRGAGRPSRDPAARAGADPAARPDRGHRGAVARPGVGRTGRRRAASSHSAGMQSEADAHRALAGLGSPDAARPLVEMSGGWRMRAALGRLLLAQPDTLILDEPTNHLDTDSVTWLEDTLGLYPGAILFVSHDRDFIDAAAERVIELAGRRSSTSAGSPSSSCSGRSGCRAPRCRGPASQGGGARRALHRALPLQGDEGPSGPEPHQDARETGAHRGAGPPGQGGPLRLPATRRSSRSWPSG